MKTKILIFLIFSASIAFGQQKKYEIDWEDHKNLTSSHGGIAVPGFADEHFQYDASARSIYFVAQWYVQSPYQNASVKNVKYQTVAASALKNLDLDNIPEVLQYDFQVSRAREKSVASLRLMPLVVENGIYKRVVSFEVETFQAARNQVHNASTGVVNSVLATGEWYRFYIENTGVHKINRDFLSSLGINVNNIDPRKIKIYGHGGEMLPLRNEDNQYYDLPQNAIKVVGEQDGIFNDEDYVLFYGIGTKTYNEESQTHINAYADRAYYYIRVDGENGERIPESSQPSGAAQHSITTFDDYQFYEVDEHNFTLLGRRWFGDRFDVQNERSYNFEFKNIVSTHPVAVKVVAAAASQINTSMRVRVNGAQVGVLSLNSIDQYNLGKDASLSAEVLPNGDNVVVDLRYQNNGNPSSRAFLDFISVEARRSLRMEGQQLSFYNKDVVGLSGIGQYNIENAAAVTEVWDVTNPYDIFSYQNNSSGNTFSFKTTLGELRKYVALLPNSVHEPKKESNARVANQNLKGNIFNAPQGGFQDVDYVIITRSELLSAATALANHRRQVDGLNVKVVELDKIYQEFSSGKQDVVAIRNFIKYVYDNASSPENRIKYIGMFGEGSVDYKNRLRDNTNVVPIFVAYDSFNLVNSFVTDDFFGMMDPNEGLMEDGDRLDIAIGRILVDSPQNAQQAVDKIIRYDSKPSYGRWRNNVVLISDDAAGTGEFTSFIVQTDNLANQIQENKPALNVMKIHADAFQQESSAGGDRYPEVNEAFNDAVEVGALVIKYFGHGGEDGLAHERILTKSDILNWSNIDRMPLFITVTCEFTRFDNPLRASAGELVVKSNTGGSVGMISTTREIWISDGRTMSNKLMPELLGYDGGDEGTSVAESLRLAKNSTSIDARRAVMYFGDPAMKLAMPKPNVRLTRINDVPVEASTDTLKALSKVKFSGEVVSPSGALLSNYNGTLSATVFDKEIQRQTLNNDNLSSGGNPLQLDFRTLGEIIFRGQASVTNGAFEFEFVVPKDIAMPIGNGRISFYSEKENELEDQKGYSNAIKIGGLNENAPDDNEGPEILLYMNDENFVTGGVTNNAPFILAKLKDENGINTASGIGHDIVAILDGDESNPYILNDYYETEVDDFTRGTTYYKLRDLEPGLHTLSFKAWDVYNNSSTVEIQFMVAGDEELSITRVLNYPNPFHNYTEFWFNHNRPFEPLEVQVQVFTVTGKVVWTQNQIINTDGFLSREITWDGKDDFGDAIGKGVYVYKLTVKSTLSNKKVEKFEKLVIL